MGGQRALLARAGRLWQRAALARGLVSSAPPRQGGSGDGDVRSQRWRCRPGRDRRVATAVAKAVAKSGAFVTFDARMPRQGGCGAPCACCGEHERRAL